jgi:hypothetical protein
VGTLVAGSPWAEGRRGGTVTVGSEAQRWRSRRGGEKRGVRMSTVELARGGGAFYRVGEAVGRRGGGRRRWSFNPRQF